MPAETFDLDSFEGEGDLPEPYPFRYADHDFVAHHPSLSPWEDIVDNSGTPREFLRLYLQDQYDDFIKLTREKRMTFHQLDSFVAKLNKHFGIGDSGKLSGSSGF